MDSVLDAVMESVKVPTPASAPVTEGSEVSTRIRETIIEGADC